jgi:hypothetical protein
VVCQRVERGDALPAIQVVPCCTISQPLGLAYWISSECEVLCKTSEGIIGDDRAVAELLLPLFLIPYHL